jgi:hypothetical protein
MRGVGGASGDGGPGAGATPHEGLRGPEDGGARLSALRALDAYQADGGSLELPAHVGQLVPLIEMAFGSWERMLTALAAWRADPKTYEETLMSDTEERREWELSTIPIGSSTVVTGPSLKPGERVRVVEVEEEPCES